MGRSESSPCQKGRVQEQTSPGEKEEDEEVREKLLRVLLPMGHPRGTAKMVFSELGIKVRDGEIDEFERNKPPPLWMIYLDRHRMKIRTDKG